MQSLKLADLTIDDLQRLIRQVVDEQLKQRLSIIQPWVKQDVPPVQDILAKIEQHRWTPPQGVSKASQLIIEERNQ